MSKTGDAGLTSLCGGVRVRKNHPRICALAALDELSCALGMARALLSRAGRRGVASKILRAQEDIIILCGHIAGKSAPAELERRLARLEAELAASGPAKPGFVIAGRTPEEAALHCARAKCRTAETLLCALRAGGPAGKYINRLSLYLFRLAGD
ncbi:MAG: ATP:cob(I)alamin adenosyltransferase [Elusimicrobiales bacterium]